MVFSASSFALSGLILASAALLLLASAHDVAARTVPNWVAGALAVLGLATRILGGTLVLGLLAASAIFVVAALCWRRGWLGGGDVKLLGGAALIVPPGQLLSFLMLMSWAGAALAVFYLVARRFVSLPGPGRSRSLLARAWRAERWRIRRGAPLPYACAIAVGCLLVVL